MIKPQELFDEAVSLPVEIRSQLVDKLLRGIHPVQKEIDELWAQVILMVSSVMCWSPSKPLKRDFARCLARRPIC